MRIEYSKTKNNSPQFLHGSNVEIIRNVNLPQPPEHALFDFDGTISLIREGWTEVMSSFMVDILRAAGTGESDEILYDIVKDFITELTGKQTIYQMIRLAEEVKKRGSEPEDPLAYKYQYHEMLLKHIHNRRESLRSGDVRPETMMVPGVSEFLRTLKMQGVTLYLASGTDIRYVLEEAYLLGVDAFFGDHIYGAVDEYQLYSKKKIIEDIIDKNSIKGKELIGFGDGYVEIEDVKSVGGIAVGVASDEAGRNGKADAWKRSRLISIGADVIIPDFRDYNILLHYFW